jgi:phage terminase large subunit-like protein
MSSRGNGRSGKAELAIFERFCRALTLEQGGPLQLEPFQKSMLGDYFDGAVETLILLPKKNGKTTLLAALALYHLIVEPDAECVVGARSRDQATILYDAAAGFVRRSPELRERVVPKRGYREIRSLRDAGRVRVLAADVDTADGVIPTLALVDELHRARSAELYGIFRDGLGPRDGKMLAISAAGENEQSPLGIMRSAARRLPQLKRKGRYTYARSSDGSYALHEWALDADDDVDDMRKVKRANPASWQTLELLARRHDSPSMLPWQWQRFACGLWVGAEAWWLDAEDWHASARELELQPGDEIALGFDGARYGDATALVACRLEDGLLQPIGVWEAPEGADDWETPTDEVDATVAAAMELYKVKRGYFDPPLWQSEIDRWARDYGDQAVIRFWTNRSRMRNAVERFRTDLTCGTVIHAGDERLTRHALNAQIRETRGGYVLTKSRPGSPEKIDAAVAGVLAYEARADQLAAQQEREPGELVMF